MSAAPGPAGPSGGAAGAPVGEGRPIHPRTRRQRGGRSARPGPAAALLPRRPNCPGSRGPRGPGEEGTAPGAARPGGGRRWSGGARGARSGRVPTCCSRARGGGDPRPASRALLPGDSPRGAPGLGVRWGCAFGGRRPPGVGLFGAAGRFASRPAPPRLRPAARVRNPAKLGTAVRPRRRAPGTQRARARGTRGRPAWRCHMRLDLTSGCFSLLTRRPSPRLTLAAKGRDSGPGGRGPPRLRPPRGCGAPVALEPCRKSLQLAASGKDAIGGRRMWRVEP